MTEGKPVILGYSYPAWKSKVRLAEYQLGERGWTNPYRSRDIPEEIVNWLDDPLLEVLPHPVLGAEGYFFIKLREDS